MSGIGDVAKAWQSPTENTEIIISLVRRNFKKGKNDDLVVDIGTLAKDKKKLVKLEDAYRMLTEANILNPDQILDIKAKPIKEKKEMAEVREKVLSKKELKALAKTVGFKKTRIDPKDYSEFQKIYIRNGDVLTKIIKNSDFGLLEVLICKNKEDRDSLIAYLIEKGMALKLEGWQLAPEKGTARFPWESPAPETFPIVLSKEQTHFLFGPEEEAQLADLYQCTHSEDAEFAVQNALNAIKSNPTLVKKEGVQLLAITNTGRLIRMGLGLKGKFFIGIQNVRTPIPDKLAEKFKDDLAELLFPNDESKRSRLNSITQWSVFSWG